MHKTKERRKPGNFRKAGEPGKNGNFKKRRSFNPRRKSKKVQAQKSESIDLNKYISEGRVLETKKYEAQNSFEDFLLDRELLERIQRKGYKIPSEIQDKTINHILEGKNIVGVAGTGTGKTAAFLIPILQILLEEPMDRYALIITPTRELANQINDEFVSMVKGLGLFSTCLIGGSSVHESIKSLKRKNHVVIGTPGRLMDMHRQGHLPFNKFSVFVLDEFDRMLDMGFKEEMRAINKMMVDKRQTLLFSATIEKSQKEIIEEIAGQALYITAQSNTQDTSAIKQDILRVNGGDKFQLMRDLLTDSNDDRTILFCETKRKAEKMMDKLKKEGVRADAIHGDKSQRAREIALRKFKRGQVNVLVATDVVARGIDVDNVSLVINYEQPRTYTDYVHRIGRTGRAGKTGRAITMID